MTKAEIAEKLKMARLKTGMTQAQVAQATGKSPKLVGHWETGYSQPDADTLSVLFKLYHVDANVFFEFEETKAPAEQEPISLEESNNLLVELGYIRPGEILTDDDLAFLTHIMGLLDAWFSKKA